MINERIVFMGSPDFAIPTVRALIEHTNLVGVVTQPDRPAGRGRKIIAPPVKIISRENEIPVIQPTRLSEETSLEQLKEWDPQVIIVAAFGQILRKNVLDLPKYGCINVHASLLPRWRGAAPIQAAILHGDNKTGVSIMLMDEGLDTGPILSQAATPIEPDETAQSLSDRLASLGAELLLATLPEYLAGEIEPVPQVDEKATHFGSLKKADGELDFQKPAVELEQQVRAFDPWPGTFFFYDSQRLIVHKCRVEPAKSPGIGKRTIYKDLPAVGTSEGVLLLERVQPAGKKPMTGDVFLRGAKDWLTADKG